MRCPKCRYIGFEEQDRCRNCGYDFSLSRPMEPIDLPIRAGDTPTTMADLRLSVQRRRSAAAALTPPPLGGEAVTRPHYDSESNFLKPRRGGR